MSGVSAGLIPATVEEARAALQDASWPDGGEGHCSKCDHTCGVNQQVVHCFLGSLGADWSLAAAFDLLGEAEQIGWGQTLFGEALVVFARGKGHVFNDARRPFTTGEQVFTREGAQGTVQEVGRDEMQVRFIPPFGEPRTVWLLRASVIRLSDVQEPS